MTKYTIKEICKILTKLDENDNHYNYKNYDFDKMVKYNCNGYDLTGSTCEASKKNSRHFLVNKNSYTVYEIPNSKNNDLNLTGNFTVLIKNNDFGYWMVAQMNHRFKKMGGQIGERVEYYNTAEFEVATQNGALYVFIHDTKDKCCRGFATKIFDDDNVRKEIGYHTNWTKIKRHFGVKAL